VAQHDYVIANGTGAAVRSDLNGALGAIVTQNSGSTEPATTYAYMSWADTTTGVMKMRNGANSAWITLYQLDGEWTSIAFENGTAAAPSIYFKDSGTDTGFYSPGADQVGITTAGTVRVTVGSTGDTTFSGNILLSGTGYLDLPAGTTGERPGSPNNGMIRYNTTLSTFEGYKAGAWGAIGGGATGGGSDDVFYENGQTVTSNYTLTTNKNAMTAGPIVINSGVTVTVPSGSSWVIV
jgi:hypothetical protein